MMTERPLDDDFDATVQRTLSHVTAAVRPDPGFADRLVANVRTGTSSVVPLESRRRAKWVLPLLAAAAVVILAVGGAVGASLLADSRHQPPAQRPTSVPFVPAPPAVPHFRARSLSFTDVQHGWALGDAQCPRRTRTDCATLLATADAGKSWRVVALPKQLVSTFDSASCGDNGTLAGPCVDRVLFADTSVGYLWSLHELYWTTDGGRNWSRYTNPHTDWDGAERLVVAGRSVIRLAPLAQCSSGCAGAVEVAPLGTANFTRVFPTTKEIGLYSTGLGVHGPNVYVFAGGTASNNSGAIVRSTDGGRTWEPVSTAPCGTAARSFFGESDVIADDGALIAWCNSGFTVAPPGSSTFSTERRYPVDGIINSVAARSAQAMTAADATHANDGERLRTTFYLTADGGHTWRKAATLPVRFDAFAFVSGSVGYAAAAGASTWYVTRDGGLTWTPKSFAG